MSTHHRYHMKHAFTNLILSYLIMLVLPITFILVLYRQAYQMSIDSCVENSLVSLRQLATRTDERTRTLDNIALQNVLYNNDIRSALSLSRPSYGDAFVYDIMKISDGLDMQLGNNSDIYQRYQLLCRNGDTIYYPGAVSLGLEDYYHSTYPAPPLSYDEWYRSVFQTQGKSFLPATMININGASTECVIYNYTICQNGRYNDSNGALQFVLPVSYLIPASMSEQENAFYLMDSQRNILCSSSGIVFPTEFSDIPETESGYLTADVDGTPKILVYTWTSSQDFIIAALYDEQIVMNAARNIRFTTVAAIFALTVVELIMLAWLSYRNAIPIHNFARNMELFLREQTSSHATGQSVKATSDYEYLEQGIHHLQQTQNSLNLMEQKNLQLQKRTFLDSILEGRFKTDREILALAESLSIDFMAKEYCVAAFSFENTGEDHIRSLTELLPGTSDLECILHDFEPHILAVLFLLQTEDSAASQELLSQCLQKCIDALSLTGTLVTAGLGKSSSSPTDIVFSYHQAKYCLQKSSNGVPVIYERFVEKKHTFYYPQEMENHLFSAVKFRETENISAIFASLRYENFIRRHLSTSMYELLIANLESTLFKLYHDLLLEQRTDIIESTLQPFKKEADAIDIVEKEFLFLANRNEETRSPRSQQLCLSIQEYLEKNYMDPNLSLSYIAEHFHFSDSYFSQFYKDSFGESFSAALENIRLKHAKQLILENRVSIEQIAQLVGYTNSTTFRRAFKRNTGYSPSSYKENADSEEKELYDDVT